MKKALFLHGLTLLVCLLSSFMVWRYSPPSAPVVVSNGNVRRTNILVTDGTRSDFLNELRFSSITGLNGAITLQTDPLRLGTSQGRVRYNNSQVQYSENGGTTYTHVGQAQTLKSPITFANVSGQFRWNSTTHKIQFSQNKGVTWTNLGTGTGTAGGGYVLHSGSHSATFLTKTKSGQFTALNSATLQLAAYANFSSLATAENVLHRIETGYSCTILRFGKSATDKLIYTQGTGYATSCGYTTYSSSVTLPAAQRAQWAEYAVQVNEAGNLTFYVNGYVFGSPRAMTSTMAAQATANETIKIYEGWGGLGGPLAVGTANSWPETGYKGLSANSTFFSAPVLRFPLSEGTGSTTQETVNAENWTIDGAVDWRDGGTW